MLIEDLEGRPDLHQTSDDGAKKEQNTKGKQYRRRWRGRNKSPELAPVSDASPSMESSSVRLLPCRSRGDTVGGGKEKRTEVVFSRGLEE